MERAELQKKLAYLESINDILSTELDHLNELMKIVGFSHGLDTVKATANEIIRKGYNINNLSDHDDL
jgi:hypothetical protein